jgi:hypothetical protein
MKISYPKVASGERFMALRNIRFMDNTRHIAGEIYTATQQTCAYYSVNFEDYQRVK